MNVVIGAALSYTEEKMRNFILSFRQFNKQDKLVLLVDAASASNLKSFSEKYDIEFINYNFAKKAQLNNSRFFFFHKYLKNNRFDSVLITDTRDVVFQEDPFKNVPERYLYCFCEDGGSTIASEEFNSYWIRNLYGQERLEEIANSPIVCAGTIMGSYNSMMLLLQGVLDEFFAMEESIFLKHAVDQGILNNICNSSYTSIIPITLKKNGDIVATVGLTAKKDVGKDNLRFEGSLVKLNEYTPAIIHQYNRDDDMQKFFDTLYAELA